MNATEHPKHQPEENGMYRTIRHHLAMIENIALSALVTFLVSALAMGALCLVLLGFKAAVTTTQDIISLLN